MIMRDTGFEPATCRRGDRSTLIWRFGFPAKGKRMRDAGFEPATSCV